MIRSDVVYRNDSIADLFKYLSEANKTYAIAGCYRGEIDEDGFKKIIRDHLGDDYSFYCTNYYTTIVIINNNDKSTVGKIIGHEGGDTRNGYSSYYEIDLCILEEVAFYKGVNVGVIDNDKKYILESGNLYTVTDRGLSKYDRKGRVLWNNSLKYMKNVNPLLRLFEKYTTENARIVSMFEFNKEVIRKYNSREFLAIDNGNYIELYNKNNGNFVDRIKLGEVM